MVWSVKSLAPLVALPLALIACPAEVPPSPPAPPAPPAALESAAPTQSAPRAADAMAYPPSRRVDQVDELHGVKVADPYRWLEDGKSAEVKKWLDDQDAFARSYLTKLPERDAIAARLKELMYVESTGVPHRFGNRWFFSRRDAGKEKPTAYYREGKNGPDKVMLDPNTWSADGSVALGVWVVSWDGKRVAYAVKSNNSDEAVLHVLDVASGKKSDIDVIEGAKYAEPAWTLTGDGFYYTWIPAPDKVPTADRPGFAEVRFHKLGTDPKKDEVVREKTGDPKTFLEIHLSKDGRWLVLTTEHGWTSTDVEVMDLRAKKREWKPLAVGKDAIFNVAVDRDRFFVHTNDGAPKYCVFRVDSAHPERDKWTEIVPERKDATLEASQVIGHKLVLTYLKDVVNLMELRDEDGKALRPIELPTIGSVSGMVGHVDDDVAYYSFQSFTYPTEIFETNVKTGKTSTWYKLKVPVDPSKYAAEQLFATSRDGTKVPFFVVRAKDAPKNSDAPTILCGYGGFQIAESPIFSPTIFPWLERGGNWVLANLRGGSEYGEEWHRHGMRREKQNVFDDYFAVAEELTKQGFTKPDKLAALGRSNGGLLVGTALTQRPDLFRVILCGVPLIDMVRYHLFGSGKTWIEEYGSADQADDFKAIYAYSPYHHVKDGTKYPATLIQSADSDDRVDPMHARKFAAEVQNASTGGPVLLRVERNSGHGGADLVKSTIEKLTDMYAFTLDRMKD
jgi:prolyl oligopeptidase